MQERYEFKYHGRKFVAIYQAPRKVWDVYQTKNGMITRATVAGKPSLEEAIATIKSRYSHEGGYR